jgi:hypothetical protein
MVGLGRLNRTAWPRLVAGLACIVAAVIPTIVLTGGGTTNGPRVVLAGAVGSLDTSFNGTGTTIQPGSTGATGVAVVPAGLPFAGYVMVTGGDGNFQVGRFTSTGLLDRTFGGTGLIDSFPGQAKAIAVVPAGVPGAGDIVAVGDEASSTCGAQVPTPVVAEYLPTGGFLNTGFGASGIVTATNPAPASAPFPPLSCPAQGGVLNAVAIDQKTGNIYVAGVAFGPADAPSTLVASLTSSGAALNPLHPSIATIVGQLPGQNATASLANAVAIAPSSPSACPPGACLGDIITAGVSTVGGTQHLTVSAFINCAPAGCPNGGAPDPGFGTGGSVTSDAPASAATAVTVLSNCNSNLNPLSGNVVAAGTTGSKFLLAQYTSTGKAVTSFNSQVTSNTNLPASGGFTGLAYQPCGNVLSADGFAGSSSSICAPPGPVPCRQMLVAQYDATSGRPNSPFGSNGVALRSFGQCSSGPPQACSSFSSSLAAVAVQPNGKTVGAGRAPVLNAVQGIGLIRLEGPTLSVANRGLIRILPTKFFSVVFFASINERLFSSVPAQFCASPSLASNPVLVNGTPRCGTVSIPAGATQVGIFVRIPVTVGVGRLQTTTLIALSTGGLSASSTQGAGRFVIEVV